jgi:RTX calcium-binding nonapeptide repeat (4 copies)
VRVTDLAGVTPGQGCVRACPRGTTARCLLAADFEQRSSLLLGDRGDYARLVGRLDGSFDGGSGNDVLIGGSGRVNQFRNGNVFTGGPGNDRMIGGPRDDEFDGGSRRNGADTISGGAEDGYDSLSYADRRNGVRADLNGRRDDGERGEGDRIDGVEDLTGGRGGDRLSGNSATNILNGQAGNDTILGGGGDDAIFGLDGSDFLSGGPGGDWVDAGNGNDTVHVRDGAPDSVQCGDFIGTTGGFDSVYLDGFDFFNPDDPCERVSRSGVTGLVFRGRVTPTTLTVEATNEVTFRVGCPPDAPPRCVGRVSFARRGRLLASTAVTLERSSVSGVDVDDMRTVRLPSDVTEAVQTRGRLSATATISFRDSGGQEIVRQIRVTFVSPSAGFLIGNSFPRAGSNPARARS